jgi:diaminopimelate decarboxylase
MGRLGQDPAIQAAWGDALGTEIAALHEMTDFAPSLVNIGGGWPREREPESRSLNINPYTVEDYAESICSSLSRRLSGAGLEVPELWLEPGRYLSGNAGVLLATVGAIKHDLDRTWINVDVSTNNLPRIESLGAAHHVLAASGMSRAYNMVATLVGGTCAASVLREDIVVPDLRRGDLVAILDAGMYSETVSNQYNGIARPATVLVSRTGSDLIKRRETVAEMFANHRVPDRLRSPSADLYRETNSV